MVFTEENDRQAQIILSLILRRSSTPTNLEEQHSSWYTVLLNTRGSINNSADFLFTYLFFL